MWASLLHTPSIRYLVQFTSSRSSRGALAFTRFAVRAGTCRNGVRRAFESKSPFLQQNLSFISMVLFLWVWVCGVLGVIVKSIINKNDIGSYREVVFDFRPKFHNGDKQSPWLTKQRNLHPSSCLQRCIINKLRFETPKISCTKLPW